MKARTPREIVAATKAVKEDGITIIRDYLRSGTIRNVRGILESETRKTDSEHPYPSFDCCHIHDLLVRYPLLADILLDDPVLDEIIGRLLGSYWIMYAFTSSSIPPNGSNYASRIHVDSARFAEEYPFNVGVIWALDDYSIESGTLEFAPYSHLHESLPSEDEFSSDKSFM